ncbi:hypothetical protein IQ226_20010 [Dolichospermum sp. LEGE 00240]|uniref:hypothetical protein n=1 Tax=Dolichospermum sp. LEGE 00240 TaxID=1828603 RepID=UPI001881E5AA|nr:hypothetical protein [Dolichospermum sp. LEGE 00240]MBE9251370.1 hypothetical protein [Dolichospermum sp. LEGE 00240]
MAAFEGAANPSEAIESGYYVHAPGKLLVDNISNRIALRPSSSHLLLGGIGSGKTTQLLVAYQQINQIEDIHAIYIDVSEYTDISKITSGVLTAIAGLEIAKLIQDSKDRNIIQSVESIRDLANGYASYNYDEYPEPHEYDEPIIVKGIIPKKSEGYGISLELVKTVSELTKYTSEKYGNLVLLFDGLDRLDDAKMFMQLVFSDAKAISSAGIGLVLVGSLTAIYGNYHDTINKSLDYFYYQPFFDVENDPEAYNFFEKIIQTRSSEDFIEASAIKALIHFSGGVLRDFITLTQASIEETYLSGEDKVQEQQVLKAVDSTGRNQLLGISDNELKIIKQILQTGTFIPRTDEDLRLLVRRVILEYRYPKLRYAVHPAMKPLIQQIVD